MYYKVKELLSPPILGDENQALTARLLNTSLLAILSVTLLVPPLLFLASPVGEGGSVSIVLGWVMAAIIVGLWILMHRGYIQLVSILFSSVLLIILTLITFRFGGLRNASTAAFALVIILITLLLRRRLAALLFTILSILAVIIAYYAERQGFITPHLRGASIVDLIIYATTFALTGSLLHFAVYNLNSALDRARQGEQAAAAANEQLKDLNVGLEDLVAARTQSLVTSAEIGRSVSTILDRDRLVQAVTDEIQEAFNYYEVHLYLLDETGQMLELAAASGVAAEELANHHHTVPASQGLVGRAARTNVPVLAPDVQAVEDWLPNPFLPDTKAEVTVPVALGDNVMGVLDIQQNVWHGLGPNDRDLLLSISGQVAVALENARLLSEARARANQEALINQIGQQIQSATTLDQAMQIAVRELGRAAHAQQARVRLGTNPLPAPGQPDLLEGEKSV